jgi:hypothetical protein
MKVKDTAFKSVNFKVTDAVYDDFVAFLKKKEFKYETPEMRILKETRKVLLKSRQDLSDTSKVVVGPNDKGIDKALEELDALMLKESEHAFVRYREVIKNRLQLAFLSAGAEQDAYYRFVLKDDRYVNDAIKLLTDKKRYDKILSADYKKEE